MAGMSAVERLEAWIARERAENGLVALHITPGPKPCSSLEEAAEAVLGILTAEGEDVTDQPL